MDENGEEMLSVARLDPGYVKYLMWCHQPYYASPGEKRSWRSDLMIGRPGWYCLVDQGSRLTPVKVPVLWKWREELGLPG